MNGLGDEFFAGTALTQNQDIGRGTGYFVYCGIDLEHFLALSDHISKTDGVFNFFDELGIVLFDPFFVQSFPDQRRKIFNIKIFFYIVISPFLHGRYGCFTRGISGHKDHQNFRANILHLFQEFNAVHFGHFQIRQNEIKLGFPAEV